MARNDDLYGHVQGPQVIFVAAAFSFYIVFQSWGVQPVRLTRQTAIFAIGVYSNLQQLLPNLAMHIKIHTSHHLKSQHKLKRDYCIMQKNKKHSYTTKKYRYDCKQVRNARYYIPQSFFLKPSSVWAFEMTEVFAECSKYTFLHAKSS